MLTPATVSGSPLCAGFLIPGTVKEVNPSTFLASSSTSSPASGFVDIDVTWFHWGVLGGVVLLLLAADLWRHREAHAPSLRSAALESLFWVGCGLAFGAFVWTQFSAAAFGEYLAGYLTEKALSVDNVFVWAMIFTSFAIPLKYQHRVLFWGIFGALALRGLFVFAGSALIQRFWILLPLLGLLLLWSGWKVLRHQDDEENRGHETAAGFVRRFMPVSDEFDGQRFFTRVNARRAATPLLLTLVVVEFTDVVFAVDSVPAILAISREPFIVFASNAFAIMGLRSMYFLLADAKERFHYLSHALGGILIFVGLKMLVSHWVHVPVTVSLPVIAFLLVAALLLSMRRNRVLGALTGTGDHDPSTPTR